MKWKNAVRDSLPDMSRTVLLSDNGVYYVAMYDSTANVFHIIDEDNKLEIKASKELLYWTELKNMN
jgi:hypothetical protein